jgi:acetylornithine deacetylase
LDELKDIARLAGVEDKVEWDLGHLERPAMESSQDLSWTQSLMSHAGVNQTQGVDYFCDAALISQGGSPSVVFGPGSIDQAHTADEWIEIESLERGSEILFNFLRALP